MVSGESTYVQNNELFRPYLWKLNVQRKLGVLHLGPVHANVSGSYVKSLSDVVAKILLPIVQSLLYPRPILQMAVLSLIMAWLMGVALVSKPYVDNFFTYIFQGSRVFTFCSVFCGFLTIVLNSIPAPDTLGGYDRWKDWVPIILLCSSGCVVFVITIWRCWNVQKIGDTTRTWRLYSSYATAL